MELDNFTGLIELIDTFSTEEACHRYLQDVRWSGIPDRCIYCDHETVYKYSDKIKFKCKKCRKFFNARTGTIFDNSKISLRKWFIAVYLVILHKKGISSVQLSRQINVTQKTAWKMLHAIREALTEPDPEQPLVGCFEVDEAYIGGKEKNKHWYKRKAASGRSLQSKLPVVGIVHREEGKVYAFKTNDASALTLSSLIRYRIETGSELYTDEWLGYSGLKKDYRHVVLNHSKNQYCKGLVHTNTIEGFWSILKRTINGTHHHIAEKYISNYLTEICFRYNFRKLTVGQRFETAFRLINYNLLT